LFKGVLGNLSVLDNPRRRRDRMFIMAEILEVAIDGALKTQMMYRANLSFAQLKEYLKLMLDLQLLDMAGNNGKTVYKTTSKGARYLQSYKEIQDLLKKERSSDSNNGNSGFLVKRGSQVIYKESLY
jgi:predicted transcriptional regulator